MNKKKSVTKKNILMWTVGIIVALLAICFCIFLVSILQEESMRVVFKEKIQSLGILGMLALLAVQFLQIFLAIIPGEPIEVLAGMCYGTVGGSIFLLVSIFLVTSTIVFLVDRYGKEFVYKFFAKEKVISLEEKLLQNSEKVAKTLCLLFFLPGTPKDLLVYIGAMLPISKVRFVIFATCSRIPSVVSSTLAGSNLLEGNFGIVAGIYIVTLLGVIFAHKLLKKKGYKGAL